jgi:hypothetical protein
MENPTLQPYTLISLVKKPVADLFGLATIFSISVDFPHPGEPVNRTFLRFMARHYLF